MNLGFSVLISDRLVISDPIDHPFILIFLHLITTFDVFSISSSTARTSLSLARDSAIMIELYLPSLLALSSSDVEHVLPASLKHILEPLVGT